MFLRELFGAIHPDTAIGLRNAAVWYGEQGNTQRALDYSEQALAIRRELFRERNPSTIAAVTYVADYLIRLKRRKDAYDLVADFLTQAPPQDPSIDTLKSFERPLLSQPIRKGFRQPPKSGKRKTKKKRP